MGAVTIVYGLYSYMEIEKDLKRGEYRSRDLQNAVFAGSIIVVAIVMSLLLL
jgi:putative membrane protein